MDNSIKALRSWKQKQEGKVGYLIAWALGIPIPILLVVFLLRGCN